MKIVLPRPGGRFVLISLSTALIVLAAIAPSFYFYTKYQQSQKLLKNPSEAQAEEVRALVAQVNRVIELPSGEVPTLATVTDKEKLSSQPFFAKSENGDKVLIFQQSKKAILYRPSSNKVIEVSTLNFTNDEVSTKAASPAPSVAEVKMVNVVLYNGTPTIGLTGDVEKKIKSDPELGSRIEVVAKENAVKKDYTKNLVVVLNPVYVKEAQSIAKLLMGSIGSLPEFEVRPTADIVVILGK